VRVIAVDSSAAMAERAREALGGRAAVACSDLLDLRLETAAGAAVSSATFHWIGDHARLFTRIHAALSEGAPFVAQCGGAGNIGRLMAVLGDVCAERPFDAHLAGWTGPWHYPTAEATRSRLERAGFDVERCWLEPHAVTHERPREFLEAVMLGPYLQRLPAGLRCDFLDRVLEALPKPVTLDFVRLNFVARRR
jgi:trans-aconitate 2-methyltransferase